MTDESIINSRPRTGAHDMLTVQEVGMIEGLSAQIVKICVWAHHTQRFEQGLMLLKRQHFECSETLLRDLARFHRVLWQMDTPRSERSTCYLCRSNLPEQSDELCKCFRDCVVARYLDPITPQTLGEVRDNYADAWQSFVVETYICENQSCGRIERVTAGVVASKFAKGKVWKTPKLCMNCFHDRQSFAQAAPPVTRTHPVQKQDRPRKFGGPLRTAIADANKGNKVELRALQETVAAESSDVAES